jgi:hypothetical protein
MKRAALGAIVVGLGIFAAPTASADPFCGYVTPCGPVQPSPGPWNGQLLPTWEVPYGGFNGGPTMCNPFNITCQGAVQNPNGWR